MVGWMLIDSKSLQPYAWVVRCADHPQQDEALWEPLSRADCPVEAVCEQCGEYLI